MKSKQDLIKLSDIKLKVAQELLSENFPDDAYYIGGYSIELLLKAKICCLLQIPDFFDFENSKSRKTTKNSNYNENLYKPFKVHDLDQLILLAGLYKELERKKEKEPEFNGNWSIVSEWNEKCRYSSGKSKTEVEEFIISLKEIKSWIMSYL